MEKHLEALFLALAAAQPKDPVAQSDRNLSQIDTPAAAAGALA